MEVPAECLQPTVRLTRLRKTAEEVDPDYAPSTPKPSGAGRLLTSRQLRRSKTIEGFRKRPPPSLSFIKREKYSVEDWRKKAGEPKDRDRSSEVCDDDFNAMETSTFKPQRSITSSSVSKKPKLLAIEYYSSSSEVAVRGAQADADTVVKREVEVNYDFEQGELVVAKIEPDEDVKDFDFANLPNFVMGTGMGTPGGPPLYDFKSLWRFELEEITMENSFKELCDLPWENSNMDCEIVPRILSIVACFSVGQILDLKKIAVGAVNVEYNPDRFAPLVMRVRNPKATALIFRTGRIVISGTKSEQECVDAAKKFARIIGKYGYRVEILNFHIQNISAKCNLNFRVRLNHLSHNKLFGNLSYEPEIFPGLEISLECPKVKVRIFCTGSIVMSGAKSMEELQEAIKIVYPLVRMYAP